MRSKLPPLIVNGWFDVRLLIVSVSLSEWTTSADVLMVTSSPRPAAVGIPVPGRVPVVIVSISCPSHDVGQEGSLLHRFDSRCRH